MKNLLYIFMISKDDIGPKEHIKNILKYTSFNTEVISNYNDEIWARQIKKCIDFKSKFSILNVLFFQLSAISYIIKNRKKYDVILLRQSVGFFIIPIIAKFLKIKIVIEVNGFQYQDLLDRNKKIFAKINKYLENISFKNSNKIICVHENLKQNLSENFKNIKNIVVVENGIETTKYLSVNEAKEKYNISNKEFRIGYLGSHAYREGIDFLPYIAQKIDSYDIKFVLIGGTNEDLNKYKNILVQFEVEDKFELYSYIPIDEALDRLKTCDICIHLRRPINGKTNSQGSPLKMLDYHNIGRYVIASDIDSYKYIEDNNFGVLVNLEKEDFLDEIVDIIYSLKFDIKIEENGKKANEYINLKTWNNQIKKMDYELYNI